MRKFYRSRTAKLLAVVFAVAMLIVPIAPALALTTANVVVTATPAFISISVNNSPKDFGIVAASSTTNTTTTYFTVTNTSSVTTNITISANSTQWQGGTPWTHNDAYTPGADQAGMTSNKGGTWGTSDVDVANAVPLKIATNQGATTNFDFGLSLKAPTSFTDGVQKTITVILTASVP